MTTTPITAPADKRFLRAHTHPTRRRTRLRLVGRIVKVSVIVAVVLAGAYRGAMSVANSSLLRIDRITVRGTNRLSKGEVIALLDGVRGQNILKIDLGEARKRLFESPWVADAVLRKRLPSTIDVLVTERRPIGIARLDGQLFLVDEHGRVFDEFGPKYAEFDLPVIDGLRRPGKTDIDPVRADLAFRVVDALTVHPDTARRVSQIDVSDPADAVVLLENDTAMLRLGDTDFLERLESYLDLAPRLQEKVASIDYVDLRYGQRVFVGGRDSVGRQP